MIKLQDWDIGFIGNVPLRVGGVIHFRSIPRLKEEEYDKFYSETSSNGMEVKVDGYYSNLRDGQISSGVD